MLVYSKPKSILEVGTAVGFSALLMSRYAPETCHITTIEKNDKNIQAAKENFKRAKREDKITLIEADAALALGRLVESGESYDFIFMDAAKAQYIVFLPNVIKLMKIGGILISDNILQDGEIIESRFAVTRRNRTIHSRMREYIYELKHNPQLESCILSVGDGITLSTKLGVDL